MRSSCVQHVIFERREIKMTNTNQQSWLRVKERLKAEVGDDIYSSWFGRMDLDGLEGESVKLSVPTRFLKSWIQSHYAERLLACCQAEQPSISRIELTGRSAVVRGLAPKPKSVDPQANHREFQQGKVNGTELRNSVAPISTIHDGLGGSPLDS